MDPSFDATAVHTLPSTPLPQSAIEHFVQAHPEWHLVNAQSPHLERRFPAQNFREAWSLAERIAHWAESADHHPILSVEWGSCHVRWSTHDCGGLSAKDLAAALACEMLHQQVSMRCAP